VTARLEAQLFTLAVEADRPSRHAEIVRCLEDTPAT
jgi:hypothetical protein